MNFLEAKSRRKMTFGQRAADKLTEFCGSWLFLILLISFLILWIMINIYFLFNSFDPYPFILLNLILAIITTIQVPIILMSQNRVSERDRLKAEYDHELNLKAEKNIRKIQEDLKTIKSILRR